VSGSGNGDLRRHGTSHAWLNTTWRLADDRAAKRTLLNFRIGLNPSPIRLLGPAETIGSTIEQLNREGSVFGGYGDSIAIYSGTRL
jgi:hypothetical protein